MKSILSLLLILITFQSFSQQNISLKGIVRSEDGKPLAGASVQYFYPNSKDTIRTTTNEKGNYFFSNVKAGKLGMLVTFIGYRPSLSMYDYGNASGVQEVYPIVMSPGINTLENITLESSKVQIKEDTVSYKIDSTMYRANDKVEDVLKQLPGVSVDKNGTVTAQGKEVTKVKVNGKEFFGGDVTTATRQLNADMVDKVQIIDDYGDQSAFTGIKDGDPSKTLNIELKKDRNKGFFGNGSVGAGTEGRYSAAVSGNYFNNSRQFSVIGNLNNINSSSFNFGSNGMMAGMARSMGIGRGGAGVGSYFGGGSDGLSVTKSIGLNYREEINPKVSVYGSYSFSHKNTDILRTSSQQNIFSNSNTNLQNSAENSLADNHRISLNMEYKIDPANYIKITPNISYRNNDGLYGANYIFYNDANAKINDGLTTTNSNSKSPNLSGSILYNHRFSKKGRTLSMNLNGGASANDGNDDYRNNTTYYFPNGSTRDTVLSQYIDQQNKNNNYRLNGSYIEPLNKKQSLEFNYAYSRQFISNDKETFNADPLVGTKKYIDSLSNIYDNEYTTNRFGVNFRTTEKKYNYSLGLAVQPATISSTSVTAKNNFTQHLVNYYPVVRFAYNFSRSRSFNVNYNGNSNQPSYSQLQPVYDYSNPQYITVGNPGLKPEFTNTFSMRYNNFDFVTGDVFFGNLSASFTQDKIVTNSISRGPGVQENRYLNSDGYFTLNAFYNISKPYQGRKYVFNLGGNIAYFNNIGFSNNLKNTGRNYVVGQRLAVDVKLKKWLETSGGVNVSYNKSDYSLLKQFNSNTVAWTFSHNSRVFLPKDFILTYDLDKTINTGYAQSVNANPFIINASLEKQVIKKPNLSLKLQAFDLLDENTNLGRTVTGNYITDTRTNKLGRYVLLTAIIRLSKFQGQAPQQGMRMRMGGDGAPPPPPSF
ncbi:MAG: outer membrane beta-barrel protein [Ferruginibacter sp.]